MTLVAILFWMALGAALGAGIAMRARIRRVAEANRPRVDDEAVRVILETGVLTTDEDEPLDIAAIEDEERRFWSERWEEPDEW